VVVRVDEQAVLRLQPLLEVIEGGQQGRLAALSIDRHSVGRVVAGPLGYRVRRPIVVERSVIIQDRDVGFAEP
jgi:hypothetical protein